MRELLQNCRRRVGRVLSTFLFLFLLTLLTLVLLYEGPRTIHPDVVLVYGRDITTRGELRDVVKQTTETSEYRSGNLGLRPTVATTNVIMITQDPVGFTSRAPENTMQGFFAVLCPVRLNNQNNQNQYGSGSSSDSDSGAGGENSGSSGVTTAESEDQSNADATAARRSASAFKPATASLREQHQHFKDVLLSSAANNNNNADDRNRVADAASSGYHYNYNNRAVTSSNREGDNSKNNQPQRYSLDCSPEYPGGFDVTVVVKVPAHYTRFVKSSIWAGVYSSPPSIRALRAATNLSIDNAVTRATDRGHPQPLFFGSGSSGSSSSNEVPSSSASSSASASGPSADVVKSCDMVTDECVVTSIFTYSKSFKFITPRASTGGTHDSRLVSQLPAITGLWHLDITTDLPAGAATNVEISIVVEAGRSTRLPAFRALAGLSAILLCAILFVAVKFLGIHRRLQHDGAAIVDPQHSEVLQDAWDEGRRLLQRVHYSVVNARTWAMSLWLRSRRRRRRAAVARRYHRLQQSNSSNNSNGNGGTAVDDVLEASTTTAMEEAKGSNNNNSATATATPPPNSTSSSSEEVDACRICRVREPVAELIAPCACAGTGRFIHSSCLARWRSMTTNEDHRRICAECKTPYNIEQAQPNPILLRLRRTAAFSMQLACTAALFLLGGYAVKALAVVVTLDRNIIWECDFYHVYLGSLVLCASLIVFTNGLAFVQDYPSSLGERIPAIAFLGLCAPILVGYAGQWWASIFFSTAVTPEFSFGIGTFAIGALLTNAMAVAAEHLSPNPDRDAGDGDENANDDNTHSSDGNGDDIGEMPTTAQTTAATVAGVAVPPPEEGEIHQHQQHQQQQQDAALSMAVADSNNNVSSGEGTSHDDATHLSTPATAASSSAAAAAVVHTTTTISGITGAAAADIDIEGTDSNNDSLPLDAGESSSLPAVTAVPAAAVAALEEEEVPLPLPATAVAAE